MATSLKTISENIGVLNERSFFPHKAQNPDALKMKGYLTQKSELEVAIRQNSAELRDWEDERQAEENQMDDNKQKVKAKMDGYTYLAAHSGRPITVQDVLEVEEFKASIRDSAQYIEQCDDSIAILQANISNAQGVLAQVNAAIEKLQSKTASIALPAKSPNSSPIGSPRSDVEEVHTASDEAHSDPEGHNSDSERSATRPRMNSM